MDITELPAALNAPDNAAVQLALSRILSASQLAPAVLVASLYEPANRPVLNALRSGINADVMSRTWDELHPAPPVSEPEPVATPPAITSTPATPPTAPTTQGLGEVVSSFQVNGHTVVVTVY